MAYEAALKELVEQVARIEQTFQGKIASSEDPAWILKAILLLEQYSVLTSRAGAYASLAFSVDMTDEAAVSRYMRPISCCAAI